MYKGIPSFTCQSLTLKLSQRANIVKLHLQEMPRVVRFLETETVVAGGRGEGGIGSCSMATDFLFRKMKSSGEG